MANAKSVQSANDRFAALQTSLTGHTVTNMSIVPGYGIQWVDNGSPRSAQIPEVQQGDTDYINQFNSLLKGATGTSGITSLSSSSSLLMTGVYIVGGYFVVRWLYKKFFKKRRR